MGNAVPPNPPPISFRKSAPKRFMSASLKRKINHWYSLIPLIEEDFPGLAREPNPEGAFGSFLVDWWVSGTFHGRPIRIVAEGAPATSFFAIVLRGWFRGAPVGREREREMPIFYLGNKLSAYRSSISEAPAGIGDVMTLTQTLSALGRAPPSPLSLPGLKHKYLYYANYGKMTSALGSPIWLDPLRGAEELIGGSGIFEAERLLSVFGIGDTVAVTIPLYETHSLDSYRNHLRSFMNAVETLEDSFDAEPISRIPIQYDIDRSADRERFRERLFVKVKCPACGSMEEAITAFEPGKPPRKVTNMMTERCHQVIYYRPPDAPPMTNIRGGMPL